MTSTYQCAGVEQQERASHLYVPMFSLLVLVIYMYQCLIDYQLTHMHVSNTLSCHVWMSRCYNTLQHTATHCNTPLACESFMCTNINWLALDSCSFTCLMFTCQIHCHITVYHTVYCYNTLQHTIWDSYARVKYTVMTDIHIHIYTCIFIYIYIHIYTYI